ncbi:MAG: Dihydrolipoyllysine-residue acetyltransferase component of pyruvate dehydrogenase complex [Anaerolineae bacterium]|nr:Dihydrolipoyllysine-residue acetyltransferase component of pyruvate dehydrogenase complex [Anaerolineae bacterium]
MATKIVMPKLGMAMKEGRVVKWLKQPGDNVAVEDALVVVESKKITYEVQASVAGILHPITEVKQMRPVGAIIGWVLQPDEPAPSAAESEAIEDVAVVEVAGAPAKAAAAPPTPAAPPTTEGGFVLASPAARKLAKDKGVNLAEVTGTGPKGRVTETDIEKYVADQAAKKAAEPPATSSAKWLARERGVDLAQVRGSGPGGRITEADVEAFLAPQPAAAAPAGAVPFSGMRQTIAEHMLESLRQAAQVTVTTEVDVTELVKLRTQLKTEFTLTYTDLIIKAVAKALKQHPRLNATLNGDEIQLLSEIHIGMAVALDEGLLVAVVRNADKKSVAEIALETQRLAAGARDGSLGMDEITGSTFTVTNLGAYGTDFFTPIINLPEVAILGVGRINEKPAIYQGEITKRSLMALSLTIDHCLVDGAPGADFLRTLSNILSNPYRILLG